MAPFLKILLHASLSGNIFFFVNKMLLLVLHNTVGINVVCVTRIHIFQNDSSMINCKKKYYVIIFELPTCIPMYPNWYPNCSNLLDLIGATCHRKYVLFQKLYVCTSFLKVAI